MKEETAITADGDFEYVFPGTGKEMQITTSCSTGNKCDTECVGGTANTSAMNATMVTA